MSTEGLMPCRVRASTLLPHAQGCSPAGPRKQSLQGDLVALITCSLAWGLVANTWLHFLPGPSRLCFRRNLCLVDDSSGENTPWGC